MLHGSKWSESNEKRITLGETPECAAVFEDFLKYLYTGKIHLNFATVVPIVSLADKYNVKDLLKLGLDYMERNVSLACKKNQVISIYTEAPLAWVRWVPWNPSIFRDGFSNPSIFWKIQ